MPTSELLDGCYFSPSFLFPLWFSGWSDFWLSRGSPPRRVLDLWCLTKTSLCEMGLGHGSEEELGLETRQVKLRVWGLLSGYAAYLELSWPSEASSPTGVSAGLGAKMWGQGWERQLGVGWTGTESGSGLWASYLPGDLATSALSVKLVIVF